MAVYFLAITNHIQVCFPAKNFFSAAFGAMVRWTTAFAQLLMAFMYLGSMKLQNVVLVMKYILPLTT